jgi:hypothetical protein
MDANRTLEESLGRFDDQFVNLAQAYTSQLKPVFDVITSIELQPEPFVENLLKFSDAVVTVRRHVDLRDLEVPPYDLWLPFKTGMTQQWEPQGLEEAKQILQGRIVSWAQYIRNVVPIQAPERPKDPELVKLGGQIESLIEACNRQCDAVVKSPLFAPSAPVYLELIARQIPSYVTSEVEFDRLLMYLYMAFDEKLRDEIRKWKPGQSLRPPLTPIAKELHEGPFHYLGILRNATAGHDQKQDVHRVTKIYQELIHRPAIDREDIAGWQSLQKALLEMLVDVLKRVRELFNTGSGETAARAIGGQH